MPKGRKWTGVAGVAKNRSGGMARVAGAGVENVDRRRRRVGGNPTGKVGAVSDQAGANISGVRNSMWLFARSTDGLYWRNHGIR